ncbi:LOW QUALITY PROTEIN: CD109 antigen-like [Paramacrobiotus metropolitanus]|uniref:LOW QUALITY PROTEIN: CD109 antigen-like n=1 Tax=Paramacrobiotus metropolitanus TaxID=2943436 RepID=UPI00244653CE|nr:LOW QUALITY PROTEIN: CD109 antigen-like [Paramacrobiotus metropolitanus]
MKNERSERLNFTVTHDMAPSATIFAYYYNSESLEVASDSSEFVVVASSSIQKVQLTVGPQDTNHDYVIPGLRNKARVKVQATPNALVGLLAVDKNLLELAADHDLSTDYIALGLLRGSNQKTPNLAVSTFSLVEMFNSPYYPRKESRPAPRPASVLRSDFRDSFMFITKQANKYGNLSQLVLVPDSITTWAVTAFAVSSTSPLSLPKKPSELRVYQELYIDMDTPDSMIENETCVVNITLFNFRSQTTSNLTFRYSVQSTRDKSSDTKLPAMSSAKLQYFAFPLGPFKQGKVSVTTEVLDPSGIIIDKVQKQIHIFQPGYRVLKTSDVVTLSPATPMVEIPINNSAVPENIVPGSLRTALTVFGDVWAPVMMQLALPDLSKEFEGLIQVPTGCGEQTMAMLMPNVFLMRYLKRLEGGSLQANNRGKILRENLEKGFARMAGYRLKDGSYNAFGQRDRTSSTWLTAFVVRGMALASEFIGIDKGQMETSLRFLQSKQHSEGYFREEGSIFDRDLGGASGRSEVLTAFGYWHIWRSGVLNEASKKGCRHLESKFPDTTDTFALALTCYVFSRFGSVRTQECIHRLNGQVTKTSVGHRCWLDRNSPKIPGYQFTAKDIETTSYALLALSNSNYTGNLTPVVDWLLSQRNPYGGFVSTQDTVVALNALSELQAIASSQNLDLEIAGVKSGSKHRISSKSLSPKTFVVPLT